MNNAKSALNSSQKKNHVNDWMNMYFSVYFSVNAIFKAILITKDENNFSRGKQPKQQNGVRNESE